MSDPLTNRTSIVIPAFNEAASLRPLVEALLGAPEDRKSVV